MALLVLLCLCFFSASDLLWMYETYSYASSSHTCCTNGIRGPFFSVRHLSSTLAVVPRRRAATAPHRTSRAIITRKAHLRRASPTRRPPPCGGWPVVAPCDRAARAGARPRPGKAGGGDARQGGRKGRGPRGSNRTSEPSWNAPRARAGPCLPPASIALRPGC